MNTLLKNSRVLIRILNTKTFLKTTSVIPVNKPFSLSFTNFNRIPKFYFSDKPPKGFENFRRKRSKPATKEKTEIPEEKTEEKPSDEKKAGNDKKDENDQKNNRSDSEGEDNKNNNNNKKGDNNNKGGFDKDTFINLGILTAIISLGTFGVLKKNTQEITMIVIIS
jgi:hypothetical protein